MKLKAIGAVVAVLMVGFLNDAARGDFTLYGSEQLTVDTSHGLGWLYGQSTVWVVSDGWLGWLGAYDSSSVNISDGSVNYLYAYEGSSVAISGGSGAYLYAYDSSTVNVSGGSVAILYAADDSTVDISEGSVGAIATNDSSTVAISGGSVLAVQTSQKSRATMSGGSVDYLYVSETSIVAISGGSVGGIDAYDSSTITFHGYDFQAMDGLSLAGDTVLGTGVLTGKWLDGTAWSVSISGHASTAAIQVIYGPSVYGDANEDGVVDAADYIALKRNFGTSSSATWQQGDFDRDGNADWSDLQLLTNAMNPVAEASTAPEPATLSLLALGTLAMIRRRR